MPKSTDFSNSILRALQEITQAGGFNTDAGLRAIRGRAEKLETRPEDLPMISISAVANTSETVKPRTTRKSLEIEILGMVDAGARDYEPQLDEIDEDITRALSPLTGIEELPGSLDVQISGGQYQHPEGGSNIAGVSHTVTVSYPLTTKPQP